MYDLGAPVPFLKSKSQTRPPIRAVQLIPLAMDYKTDRVLC